MVTDLIPFDFMFLFCFLVETVEWEFTDITANTNRFIEDKKVTLDFLESKDSRKGQIHILLLNFKAG